MTNLAKSVLVLRACNPDMSSRNGFVWPTSGPVEALDWNPIEECGNGLHGWLHGHGAGDVCNYTADDCKWLVVKVKTKHIVDLDGKVKFKKGKVVFCGDRKSATDYLIANDPIASTQPVIASVVFADDSRNAISTDFGSATASRYGLAVSGGYGVSNCGGHGISISGTNGKSTSGYNGISYSKDQGTSISNDDGISISKYNGISKANDCGIAISYAFGLSSVGNEGMAFTGEQGVVSAGVGGIIIIRYYKDGKYQYKVGHIGKDGLCPGVKYKLDINDNFIEA